MMGINPKTVPEPKYSMRPMIICGGTAGEGQGPQPLNTLMEAREMIKGRCPKDNAAHTNERGAYDGPT